MSPYVMPCRPPGKVSNATYQAGNESQAWPDTAPRERQGKAGYVAPWRRDWDAVKQSIAGVIRCGGSGAKDGIISNLIEAGQPLSWEASNGRVSRSGNELGLLIISSANPALILALSTLL